MQDKRYEMVIAGRDKRQTFHVARRAVGEGLLIVGTFTAEAVCKAAVDALNRATAPIQESKQQ
jgi:hypothetical protein